MKLHRLKKQKTLNVTQDKTLNIQNFGEANDYPQSVVEVVTASGTGRACVGVYAKFIKGKGFLNSDLDSLIVNSDGQTLKDILKLVAFDRAMFNGFSVHCNMNLAGKIISIYHVPFEHVRFERVEDDEQSNSEFKRYGVFEDWGKRNVRTKRIKPESIDLYHRFEPTAEAVKRQIESDGGLGSYKGQLYYFSGDSSDSYPLPIFDAVLTDMNTEEGLSNITNRNARNNNLAGGMLINIDDGSESDDELSDDLGEMFYSFMGDENAGNIAVATVKHKDDVPLFVDFSGKNRDKEFTVSNDTTRDKIGRSFVQPPILRAEDVGANFGADLMKNAYNYYNSITEDERGDIETAFNSIIANFKDAPADCECYIDALTYSVENNIAEELAGDSKDLFEKILFDEVMNDELKRKRLKTLFDFSDEILDGLFL